LRAGVFAQSPRLALTTKKQNRPANPQNQKQNSVGQGNLCIVHVSLVPVIGVVGEQKTKPTQHSVAVLRSLGLHPHLLACRCAEPLDEGVRSKLALFCQVPTENVLTMHDVSNLWRVPLLMQEQKAHETVCRVLGLGEAVSGRLDMRRWKGEIADRWDALKEPVRIALIGKYTGLSDAYLSVVKSLQHACLAANLRLVLDWVDAAHLEAPSAAAAAASKDGAAAGGGGGGSDGGSNATPADKHAAAWATVRSADGILVPGGFGTRGTEGKIAAARYARENKVPFLGICLGMQLAVIEFARSVLGISDADSAEFNPATAHPAVVFMPEISTEHMGGTMRLGARRTVLQTMQCATAKLYQRERDVFERHRHRYEVNPALVPRLEAEGLRFVGKDETGERMEILELEDNPSGHPFYVAAQFHPEVRG
jgi:CTP synthase